MKTNQHSKLSVQKKVISILCDAKIYQHETTITSSTMCTSF
jgi:hypothetical protein